MEGPIFDFHDYGRKCSSVDNSLHSNDLERVDVLQHVWISVHDFLVAYEFPKWVYSGNLRWPGGIGFVFLGRYGFSLAGCPIL